VLDDQGNFSKLLVRASRVVNPLGAFAVLAFARLAIGRDG